MSDDQDQDPAELDQAKLLQELVNQNKELLARLDQEQQANKQLLEKMGRRSDGSLNGGYVFQDGQIHFNDPKLSDEKLWDKMESEGGVLG